MIDYINEQIEGLVEEAAGHATNDNSILELRSLQKAQAYATVAIALELKRLNDANAPRTYVGDEVLEDIPLP